MRLFKQFIQFIKFISFTTDEYTNFLIYKWFKRNNIQRNEEDIAGKCVVLTGGSSGIGKASASEFARRGGIVVIGDKDLQNGQKAVQEIQNETGNRNVTIIHLDLSDMDSVEEFAKKVSADYPKIKILFNNAGIGISTSENIKTKDGFNIHVAVNYLGHFLLTNLLMNNLKSETNSRIVSTSSFLGLLSELDVDDLHMDKSGFGLRNLLPYCNTKFCLALFTKELESCKGVNSYALCPGSVITPILNNALPKVILHSPLWKMCASTPSQAASEFVMYCALEKSISSETGKMYRFRKHFHKINKCLDSELARELWEKSSTLVKLNERLSRIK